MCVASVDRVDLDVRADDECQARSKCGDGEGRRRSGCGLDPFEIAQRSFRGWRRSEPLDERMSKRNASFERVAQCALMHTALPLGRADLSATMRQRSGRHCTFGQKPRKGRANSIMKMSSRRHVVTTLGQSLRVKPPDPIVRKLRNALREQSWSDSVWRS